MSEKPIHIFIFPLMPKTCPVCGSSNPLCAKYCGDCGSSFIKSPDLLQSKSKDKNTRNDTEPYALDLDRKGLSN